MSIFKLARSKIGKGITVYLMLLMMVEPAYIIAQATKGAFFFMNLTPAAMADAITDAGAEGASFGRSVNSGFTSPSFDGQAFDLGGGQTPVDINELFFDIPGSGNTTHDNTMGNPNALDNVIVDTQGRLSSEATPTGNAYRTITETMYTRAHPDMRNDPIFTATKGVYAAEVPQEFGDCQSVPVVTEVTQTDHIPDIRTCERVADNSAQCVINHNYEPALLNWRSGNGGMSSCGDGCLDVWIGRVGDNYWSGWCTIYENDNILLDIVNPDAIISASINYAKWDDYIQIYLGGQKVYNGPNANFPPETGGACELSTSWALNPNVDVTNQFKLGGTQEFKIRVSVAGNGEGFARVRILYDSSRLVVGDVWEPQSCIDAALGIVDGACQGSFTCTQMPAIDPTITTGDCIRANGLLMCEDTLQPSPIPGIRPLCKEVSVDAQCGFYQGDISCYVNALGETVCPSNTGGNLDTCLQYEQDPACAFIESQCMDNSTGSFTGKCYIFEEQYDCGYTQTTVSEVTQDQFTCDGAVRCMGDECFTHTPEVNSDFGKSAAFLEMMNFTAMDMDCPTNNECYVFGGDAMECKKAVGGHFNCCEKISGVSIADWLQLLKATREISEKTQLASKLTNLGLDVNGAWSYTKDAASATWNAIKEPFASAWEQLAGEAASATVDQAGNFSISAVTTAIQEEVAQFLLDTFGKEVASSMFEMTVTNGTVTSATWGGSGAWVASALSYIMMVYMWFMIAYIILTIYYECEDQEMELGVQRELGNCHHIGNYCFQDTPFGCLEVRESYCCFGSPLSRIMQEQLRPQITRDWGTPEDPDCGALPMDILSTVDWNLVDLSEWESILRVSDMIPSQATMEEATTWSYNPTAPDAATRTQDRFIDTFPDDTREKVREDLWGQ